MKFVVFVLFAVLGLSVNAQPLQFRSDTIDRGVTTWYHPVTAVYKFRNVSGRDLTITDVDPGCGCMQPSWTQGSIPPKGEGEVKITYIADLLGRFDRLIAVTTDADEPTQFIRMKCKVVAEEVGQQPQTDVDEEAEIATVDQPLGPRLGVPSYCGIGPYQANKTVKASVIIKNEGDELLLIDGIKSQSAALQVKDLQLALKPGKLFKIKFTVNTLHIFSPAEPLTLQILSNDPQHSSTTVHVVFE